METGFIKLYRKMVDWQWYSDTNVFRVFTHLLLTANYKDKAWQNIIIKRGQKVTSLNNLSEEINLTKQQTRTALSKLQSSNEITLKATNKYTIVTIVKYNDYQDIPQEINTLINKQITNEQQTNNTQDNIQITTTKEYKEIKNSKNIYNIPKNKYGEYKHVLLSQKEYETLVAEYGEEKTKALIKYLDEYIEMKGYKAKSHYLCMKKWVIDAISKNNQNKKSNLKYKNYEQRNYDDLDNFIDTK